MPITITKTAHKTEIGFSQSHNSNINNKQLLSPVNSEILAATFSANPICVFIPVPTAVPPTAQKNCYGCMQAKLNDSQ